MKAALKAFDLHIVTAVSATWIMGTLAVMAKKRRRAFGTVVRLPSGRYQARYFDQGVFHNAPETYCAVADANACLTVEESKILQGTWVPVAGSALMVAGLAGRWLASNPLKRDSSRSRDASTLTHYIKPVIGALKVAAPTKVTLQGLVDNWTAVDHLAPSTVHRMASTLHALFQYAVDDKKRLDNPADDLKLPEVAQGDMVELTPDDYGRLAQPLGPGHSTFMSRGRDRPAVGRVRRHNRWRSRPGRGHAQGGAPARPRPTTLPHQEQDDCGHRPERRHGERAVRAPGAHCHAARPLGCMKFMRIGASRSRSRRATRWMERIAPAASSSETDQVSCAWRRGSTRVWPGAACRVSGTHPPRRLRARRKTESARQVPNKRRSWPCLKDALASRHLHLER